MSGYSFVTVGTDGQCDFDESQFQTAVSSETEVRITNQVVYDSINVINHSVTIKGGYNSCNDAVNDNPSNIKTLISGQDSETVVEILTTAAGGHAHRVVNLQNLVITDGLSSGSNLAGGVDISGNVDVSISDSNISANVTDSFGGGLNIYGYHGATLNLNNVIFETNEADDGGAMYLSSGAVVTINGGTLGSNFVNGNGGGVYLSSNSKINIFNTVISSNTALTNGGGVACNNSEIYIDADSLIVNNSANIGGGIEAVNHCEGVIESGNNNIPSDTSAGLISNTGVIYGGAAYVFDSDLLFKGSSNHYVNIKNNTTDTNVTYSQGGGIYARGNSIVTLINTWLEENTSVSGSAISSKEGAVVKMFRQPGTCFAGEKCSLISGNTSSYGTIRTESCGLVKIFTTTITDNIGTYAVANLNGNESSECMSIFEGNLIYSNQGDAGANASSLFQLDRKAGLEFAFNTVTDNPTGVIFRLNSTNASEQTLHFNSSIIWNSPSGIFSESNPTNHYSGNCFLLHSSQNVPADFGGIRIYLDPAFNNSANSDYRLTFESPPIDRCDTSLYLPVHHDIISIPRGLHYAPPVLGYHDMGAFEYEDGTYLNDVVFYDRFD